MTKTDHAHDAVEAFDGNYPELARAILDYGGHDTSGRAIDAADVRFSGELGCAHIELSTYHPLEGNTNHTVRLDFDHPITGLLYAALSAADRKDTTTHAITSM